MNLPIGTLLQGGKYKIVEALGQGTFGITYRAKLKMQGDLGALDFYVAIKEFFMKEKNERRRDGSVTCSQSSAETCEYYRKKFKHEAENLSKMRHGNIVKVNDVFDENNTSYYVMELVAGGSLDSYIDERHGLPEGEALRILREAGSAISYMHSKRMLHLDIKPNNIMRRYDGHIFLIDFGLSKQFNKNGEPESSTHVGLGTEGYAPPEQSNYKKDGSFPATLDIYALGATLYKMLTGSKPPLSTDIINYGFDRQPLRHKGVSDGVISVIEKAMKPKKAERYQSVAEMLSALPVIKGKGKEEKPEVINMSEEDTPEPSGGKKDDDNKKKFKTYAIGAMALVIILVAAFFLFPKPDPDPIDLDSILSIIPDSLKSQNAQSLSSADSGSSVREEPKVTVNPTLTLSCKTSGASLYVDGKKKGTGNWSGELSAGTHKVEARLDGFKTETEILSLANGGTYSHTFPELTAISNTSVVTNPTLTLSCKTSGASLYVDGKEKGTGKWSGELSAGKHKVEARMEGYQTETETLSLENGGNYSHTFPTLTALPKETQSTVTTNNTSTSVAKPTTGTINGHDYVDLGLSVKWATCNVGANSPTDYGNYYAWGETATKKKFTKKNSSTNGKSMGDIAGNSSYDAARANWGGTWRLPTEAEFLELIYYCKSEWTTVNGVEGRTFTSKKNGMSIFFPAAGWREGTSLYYSGEAGEYWSSTPSEFFSTVGADNLYFYSLNCDTHWRRRSLGQSVRPVSE